jgi:DNA polymerase-3 subunit gamma/tau
MIRGLERELKGVEVSEIMVTTQPESEVITITEDEIVATLPKKKENDLRQAQVPEKDLRQAQVAEGQESTMKPSTPSTSSGTETTTNTSTPSKGSGTELNKVAEPVEVSPHQKTFDTLIKKIYDRDYDLGSCFEKNITFESFKERKLTWGSTAEDADKKQLITHWGLINMFVKELFGFETKIVNIAKKKVVDTSTPSTSSVSKGEEAEMSQTSVPMPIPEPVEGTKGSNAPHSDANSGSMIEDIEMKSSCITPEAGETESAKEKDPSTLLEEPMVKEAIALFDPKKVRIKRNT